MEEYDFCGWATKVNLTCSDGRTILPDAFKENDGEVVPLVWMHQHNDPLNVLGRALLENRPEGVYVYGTFNQTENGKAIKEAVCHGDITALSICANNLKEQGKKVIHGAIREVSLVLAGANPGAFIDNVLSHGNTDDETVIIYTGEPLNLFHAEEKDSEKEEETEKKDQKESVNETDSDEKTVADVYKTLTDEQQTVVNYMVEEALKQSTVTDGEEENETENSKKEESKGGDKIMKHNVFENDTKEKGGFLAHADQMEILNMAKQSNVGTFQTALELYEQEHGLQHDAVSSGFVQTGDGNISLLFPEYKDVRPGAPELITNDQGWVTNVMSKVHKSPISRIRTTQADIRNIDAIKGKGYVKGKNKALSGNIKLVRRTTDPQTVYIKDALHRDDIIDITDFDYVAYLYNMDRLLLNEELAMSIMIGDGREDGDEGKIYPEHIRPIWLDDDLYTVHVDLNLEKAKAELQGSNTSANFGANYIYAEAMIDAALCARENYKGTGTPDFYCTPHSLNMMLLARDINGRRIYSSKAELATALNVGGIYTAEQFVGKTRTTSDNKTKKLLAIITNLADYSLGATKGGEITHFTSFDIDFNQLKSLLETRVSGALTRVYSAIAIEEDVTATT